MIDHDYIAKLFYVITKQLFLSPDASLIARFEAIK